MVFIFPSDLFHIANALKVHDITDNKIFFNGWIIFHCTYTPHFLYLFIH